MKKCLYISIAVLLLISCVSCSKNNSSGIVFTMGLDQTQVFKLGSEIGKLSEAKLLLYSLQKQYEKVFGEGNWEQKFENETLGEYVKQQVIIQLSQLKSMYLMADHLGIQLTEEEMQKVKEEAFKYDSLLTDGIKKDLDISLSQLENLFKQYALGEKLYQEIIQDVDSKVSDDEARIIIVEHILLKTYHETNDGSRIEFEEEERTELNKKVHEIWEKAKEEESFESLASTYSEDILVQYTIARGDMPYPFEKAAFNLKNGEISPIVETEFGLHIIKCISNNEKDKTETNKIALYNKRCEEVFNQEYDAFMKGISEEFNHKLWGSVELVTVSEFPDANIWERLGSREQGPGSNP